MVKPFTDKMVELLLKVYGNHGKLRVRSLRNLGISTVAALERRKLLTKMYDRGGRYWILSLTERGERLARKLER